MLGETDDDDVVGRRKVKVRLYIGTGREGEQAATVPRHDSVIVGFYKAQIDDRCPNMMVFEVSWSSFCFCFDFFDLYDTGMASGRYISSLTALVPETQEDNVLFALQYSVAALI